MEVFENEIKSTIKRLQRLSKKKRTVYVSDTGNHKKYNINSENNGWFEGNGPSVTFSNLGLQDDPGRIRWPSIRYPIYRRIINYSVSFLCTLLPASKIKNTLYRSIGFRIGRNVEICLSAFLDPFCPKLIKIGEGTLLGSFARVFSHAYIGNGDVIVGEVKTGQNCRLLIDCVVGPICLDDGVVIMPKTMTMPYFKFIKKNSVVGFLLPHLKEKISTGKIDYNKVKNLEKEHGKT